MTDRVLIGQRNDGSYGMDISLPGYDVFTATNTQLAFSTRWGGAGSVHQTGIVNRGVTVYFPTLPYIPLCVAFIVDASGQIRNSQYLVKMGPTQLGDLPNGVATDPVFEVTSSSFRVMTIHPKYLNESYGGAIPAGQQYRYAILRIAGS